MMIDVRFRAGECEEGKHKRNKKKAPKMYVVTLMTVCTCACVWRSGWVGGEGHLKKERVTQDGGSEGSRDKEERWDAGVLACRGVLKPLKKAVPQAATRRNVTMQY